VGVGAGAVPIADVAFELPASVVVVIVVLGLLLPAVDPNLNVVVGVSRADPFLEPSDSEVVDGAVLVVMDALSVLPANKWNPGLSVGVVVAAALVIPKLKPLSVAGAGSLVAVVVVVVEEEFWSLFSVEVFATDVGPKENPPLDSTFLLLSPTVPKLNNPGAGAEADAVVLPPNRFVPAVVEGCAGAIDMGFEEPSVAG
jgi:hypothetical protein